MEIKNIRRLFALVLVFLALQSQTYSQTVSLPDTNFRNVLLAKYPFVMSGNNLNISAANNFPFDLLIQNANISNLTGVEHFTSVFKIDASWNKITYVPNLSGNNNLEYIYLNFNQLTDVNFMVGNTNLLQLQLYNNRLTSFPVLPGFTKLQKLFLSGNQLNLLPGLSQLVNLTNLQISTNRFEFLPDLSQNIKLTELHCDGNRIKELNDIEKLVNLKILYCWGNSISDLSLLNNNTILEELYVNDNLLNTLPVLINKPGLKNLSVFNNQLTFEDLLPVANHPGLSNFVYAPQDSIGEKINFTVRILDSLDLIVREDAAIATNKYTWYKNNQILTMGTSGTYSIDSTTLSDAGIYSVDITNSALPLLTLHHQPWTILVNSSCMDILSYGYRIISKDCKDGTKIQVELLTSGSELPLTYSLIPNGSNDSIQSSSEIFSNIQAGQYSLGIKDQRGCFINVDSNLIVHGTADCDPVISPLGNGSQSTYYIDKPGLARIIHLNGTVIRELQVPAIWDGTKADGSLVDTGYYVITVDDKKHTNISVIR